MHLWKIVFSILLTKDLCCSSSPVLKANLLTNDKIKRQIISPPLQKFKMSTPPQAAVLNRVSSKVNVLATAVNQDTLSDNLRSLILTVSYMAVIVSVMSMSATLSEITKDQQLFNPDNWQISSILALSTLSTMTGKFVMGPLTDKFGGKVVLFTSMALVSLALFSCSRSDTLTTFGISWACVSFIYAATSGAIQKIIRESFDSTQWATQLGFLAAGSRFGSMFSSIAYGFMLEQLVLSKGENIFGASTPWRFIFLSASAMLAVVFAVNSLVYNLLLGSRSTLPIVLTTLPTMKLTDGPAAVSNLADTTITKISELVLKPSFWCMLIAKMSLMLTGHFVSFIPLYLTTGMNLVSSSAAKYSAFFAVGSLISSLVVTRYYQSQGPKSKIRVVLLHNIASTLLSAALILNSAGYITLPIQAVIAILFVWGMTWCLPFYIPPGILALQLGGAKHSALVTNLFDAIGFLASAVFSVPVTNLGKEGKWTVVFGLLTGASAVATIGMYFAMRNSDLGAFTPKNKKKL